MDTSTACTTCQEAISAQIDSEATVEDLRLVAAHLPDCRACTDFADRALARRRALRLASAGPASAAAVDFRPTALAASIARAAELETPPAGARAAAAGPIGRLALAIGAAPPLVLALAVVGTTQMVLGTLELLGAVTHDGRHLSAWTSIFGLMLLLGALRPATAPTLAPVAVAVPLLMLTSAGLSWANGDVIGLGESTHVLELVGGLLLVAVARGQGWRFSATRAARSGAVASG